MVKVLTEFFNFMFGIEARGVLQPDMLTRLKEKVEGWFCEEAFPSLQEITCAASLAHYGLVSSVRYMRLRDVNLTSVPAQHLASLVSCVTRSVEINNRNVIGCDLVSLWPSLRCEAVDFSFKLEYSEEQALVQAMRRHLHPVYLRIREGNRYWITYSELDPWF